VRLPYELFIALRYLLFHRGRAFLSVITLISVAGVSVGTAALVIALSLMTGFEEDVRERILGGNAHLTVTSSLHLTFGGAEETACRLVQVPGVAAVGPVLYTPAMLSLAEEAAPAYAELQGVDPQAHARVTGASPFATATLARLGERTASGRAGILLGETLARRLGAAAGDGVRVFVPSVTLGPLGPIPRSQAFEVIGTYHSENFQEDSQRAYLALAEARRLMRSDGLASWLEVRLEDLRELGRMKGAIQAALGPAWSVVDLIEVNQDLIRALNTERLALLLAIGLIVVVAALNIVSTLILMVTDKVRDIGTLTALGARPQGIALVFVFQGLVIGVVGTAAGLSAGAGLAAWLDRYRVIPLNPEVYYLAYVPFTTRPADAALVGVLAVVISLMATIYPAWKAARLDPIEALRHE
jgi:lipoprotein-releasing system permease protein